MNEKNISNFVMTLRLILAKKHFQSLAYDHHAVPCFMVFSLLSFVGSDYEMIP